MKIIKRKLFIVLMLSMKNGQVKSPNSNLDVSYVNVIVDRLKG